MADEITDELLEAIWREACSRQPASDKWPAVGKTAIRLALSGWRPTDPDLILARECAADTCADGYAWHQHCVDAMRNGLDDTDRGVQSALRAIKAVRKQMAGK